MKVVKAVDVALDTSDSLVCSRAMKIAPPISNNTNKTTPNTSSVIPCIVLPGKLVCYECLLSVIKQILEDLKVLKRSPDLLNNV